MARGAGRELNAVQWYPAPGKLNLFLHVLGRRADGYHELQTVFRLIDRADRVGIASRDDGVLRRLDALPGVQAQDDLCLRAAARMKDIAAARGGAGAARLGADIALDKRLPMGAGLGGGSSDAATVMLVLNRLWALSLGRAALIAEAAQLGADVPFFVLGRNALGEGIGERLSALELPPAWYLVLVPPVSVSTREVFASFALTGDTKPLKITPFFQGLGRNDLEPVVTARYPEVAAHLDWLRQHCPGARMTGSGACVFAEFDSAADARALQSRLPASMQGFLAEGLARHPLHDWAQD
ncbi:MAG: 4-diphosphocytidyl-2C-methyl-D-erythritol kinase [Betaproteobacteria bacterium SG8_39]|nr:MAG: 4-diphosphocytidyl-2C-methyl-D-erythritol kinase [Betaproteobacteria bacterium SG8_39]